jgi:hypothetical protein
MRVFGWTLFGLGIAVAIFGFAMDATIPNDALASLGSELPARTYNLGLLQNRELTVQLGLVLMVCGSIFTALSSPTSGASQMAHLSSDEVSDGDQPSPADADELERLGITTAKNGYRFQQDWFATAAEAIAFARANQWMRSGSYDESLGKWR